VVALRRRETLTSQLTKALAERIAQGHIRPGEKLPSEQELIDEFGVSRTVVREAISSLRASGVVSTQQGVGAFVVQPEAAPAFRVDEANLGALNEVVAVLELRISVEAEAAALAAQRRTPEQLATMRDALDRMATSIADGEDAIGPDLDFHRTVAEATGNRYFLHLFNYLGSLLIPRTRVQTFQLEGASRRQYLDRVNGEHNAIYQAIADQDPDSARGAMRVHLTGSRERIRRATEG